MQELREDLLNLLADVEAGLDFADEDIHFVGQDDLLKRLGKGMAQVMLVSKQLQQRAVSEQAFRVVLAGKPNAGKSSLFNALAGATALVSPQPGTTRDYLVQRLKIGELVDRTRRYARLAERRRHHRSAGANAGPRTERTRRSGVAVSPRRRTDQRRRDGITGANPAAGRRRLDAVRPRQRACRIRCRPAPLPAWASTA